MDSITEFFSMGGYAAFVWPAFAVALIVMVGLLVVSRRGLRANEATLAALEAEREQGTGVRRAATAAGAASESGRDA